MRFKRFLSIMLVLLMIVAISGCQATTTTAGTTTSEATTTKSTTESTPTEQLPRPVGYDVVSELKAYTEVMPLVTLADLWGSEVDPTDNTAKYILDNFKIDTTGLTVDMSGKYADLVRAKLAASDLPDVLLGFNYALFREIAASGYFLDISKELKDYAPDTIDNIGEEVLAKYREPDGKLYLFPSNTIPVDDLSTYLYPQDGPMLNMDFLEQAGLPVPTNTDELYNTLKAFAGLEYSGKKVIPMGNGGFMIDAYTTDGYPWGSNHFMHMFEPGTGWGNLVKNDATQMIDTGYDHPTYLKFLQFFNKLYREKLLDQDAFTLTKDAYNERVKSGVYGFFWGGTGDTTPANTALSGTVLKPYQPIEMVKNYEGNSKTYNFSVLGNWYFLFNKDIKDPVRLAKYINWQYTLQGVQIINYGAPDKEKIKNVWYYDDDGKVVFDQELQKKWDAEDYTWNWKKAGGWGFHSTGLRACIKYTAVNEMGLLMADDMYIAIDTKLNTEMTMDPAFEAMNLQPIGEVCLDRGASLRDLLNKWEVRIILNAKDEADAETMYAQMISEAKAAGYEDIKKEMYDRYIAANPAS